MSLLFHLPDALLLLVLSFHDNFTRFLVTQVCQTLKILSERSPLFWGHQIEAVDFQDVYFRRFNRRLLRILKRLPEHSRMTTCELSGKEVQNLQSTAKKLPSVTNLCIYKITSHLQLPCVFPNLTELRCILDLVSCFILADCKNLTCVTLSCCTSQTFEKFAGLTLPFLRSATIDFLGIDGIVPPSFLDFIRLSSLITLTVKSDVDLNNAWLTLKASPSSLKFLSLCITTTFNPREDSFFQECNNLQTTAETKEIHLLLAAAFWPRPATMLDQTRCPFTELKVYNDDLEPFLISDAHGTFQKLQKLSVNVRKIDHLSQFPSSITSLALTTETQAQKKKISLNNLVHLKQLSLTNIFNVSTSLTACLECLSLDWATDHDLIDSQGYITTLLSQLHPNEIQLDLSHLTNATEMMEKIWKLIRLHNNVPSLLAVHISPQISWETFHSYFLSIDQAIDEKSRGIDRLCKIRITRYCHDLEQSKSQDATEKEWLLHCPPFIHSWSLRHPTVRLWIQQ